MFQDRRQAGRRLARALEEYGKPSTLVLAIPMGGIQVACEVSRHLGVELSPIIVRKLPFPDNPEAGFGAVAEDGSLVMLRQQVQYISEKIVQRIVEQQKEEITRRKELLRGGAPLPELAGRTIILIDDGIAMGSTMEAAIWCCKKSKPSGIIVAAPVAAPQVKRRLSRIVDRVVVLEEPFDFRAVAQVYENWYDVPDWEAVELLERWRRERGKL